MSSICTSEVEVEVEVEAEGWVGRREEVRFEIEDFVLMADLRALEEVALAGRKSDMVKERGWDALGCGSVGGKERARTSDGLKAEKSFFRVELKRARSELTQHPVARAQP